MMIRLTLMSEVPCSNPDGTSTYLAEIVRGSFLSAQAYAGVVPEMEPHIFSHVLPNLFGIF